MRTTNGHQDLLDIAQRAIVEAFEGTPADLDADAALADRGGPAALVSRSAFVTVQVAGELNGCIGAIDDPEPLGRVIARLARSAAFGDPRLPELRPDQLGDTEITISLLSDLEPVPSHSRRAVLAALAPGVHGLEIAAGWRRGLFLPEVWEKLPDGERFLDHLLTKAGLRPGSWPRGLGAARFTTETFSRPLSR